MALMIRMRQHGRKNHRVFRVVVTDSRNRRDGKYVESLGWYNPHEAVQEKSVHLDVERVKHWIGLGAQMSEKASLLVGKVIPEVIKGKKEAAAEKRKIAQQKRRARRQAKGKKA